MTAQGKRSRTSSPMPSSNGGNELAMGLVIGQLVEHARSANDHSRSANEHMASSNEHLAQIRIHLVGLPERIAERLPKQETTPPPNSGKLIPVLKAIKELVQWVLPLALLASVVTGKLTMPEALPIIRQALGIH